MRRGWAGVNLLNRRELNGRLTEPIEFRVGEHQMLRTALRFDMPQTGFLGETPKFGGGQAQQGCRAIFFHLMIQ